MKAEKIRPGGHHVVIEHGSQQVPVPVQRQAEVHLPLATAPLWEHAKIQAGPVLVLARACEVSVPEFIRRYV